VAKEWPNENIKAFGCTSSRYDQDYLKKRFSLKDLGNFKAYIISDPRVTYRFVFAKLAIIKPLLVPYAQYCPFLKNYSERVESTVIFRLDDTDTENCVNSA